jgi:hypothetical protein
LKSEVPALPPYTVVVDSVSGGEIANLLKGHIIVGKTRIPFTGVAYGRIGGQNVMPKLSPASRRKVKEAFGEVERFEDDLQMRLVNGDFDMPKHAHPEATL